jgi:hypothetical protein
MTDGKSVKDYYRPAIYIPKQDEERIQGRADALGLSVSSYVCWLIENDIGVLEKANYGTPGKGRRKKS